MKREFLFLSFFLWFSPLLRGTELPSFNTASARKTLDAMSVVKAERYIDSMTLVYGKRSPQEAIDFIDFSFRYIKISKRNLLLQAKLFLRRAQQYRKTKKYALAIGDLLRSEECYLKLNDLSGLQQVFISYANVYSSISQNVKAIKYALKAKEYAEKLKENESIGVACNTLANLYLSQAQYDSALVYYRESLKLLRLKKNYTQEALLLDNIAILFVKTNKVDSAGFYNQKALDIACREKDVVLELQLLFTACSIEEKRENFEKEGIHAERAVLLADSLHYDDYKVYAELTLATVFINKKKPRKGIPVLLQNIDRLKDYDDYASLEVLYGELSRAYEMLHMADSALFYYKQEQAAMDTLDHRKATDDVNNLLAQRQVAEREARIQNLRVLNKTLHERDALQSMVIWISTLLLIVIAVLLGITFKRFRDNRRLNRLLTLKNAEIQEKSNDLELKNNEITDSINYARKIQFALLPDEKEVKNLFQDFFILYMPKDIVSGDFYWVARKDNFTYLVVGDCTGHGVPGGFMTMLAHSFLNDIILDNHESDPGRILDLLRARIIRALKQTGATGESKDGMDCMIVVMDNKAHNLKWAGANNSAYMIRQNELTELQPDKQPVGFYHEKLNPFTTRSIDFSEGDSVYLFTDGFADQFGGPKEKKFLYRRFRNLIFEGRQMRCEDQKMQLMSALNEWKGKTEQIDDVCVIGVRL